MHHVQAKCLTCAYPSDAVVNRYLNKAQNKLRQSRNSTLFFGNSKKVVTRL